jgi:hypothetical protein
MTQAERFLKFVQERNERYQREAQVLVRIENDELVITHHWLLPRFAHSGTNVGSTGSPAACQRHRCGF